jgi:hypothetical protein
MIVTARFIVVRSGTSECGFFSVGMVTEERTSCCVSHPSNRHHIGVGSVLSRACMLILTIK